MSTYVRRAAVAFGLCAAACAANTPPSAQCAAPVPPPPPAQELEGGRASASAGSTEVDVEMIHNGALLEIRVPDAPGAAEAIPALRALLGRHADWMASTRQCPAVRAAGEPG